MESIKSVLKRIAIFFSWLLFSPLYFFLSKRYLKSRLWVRAFWLILSPFTLFVLLQLLKAKESYHFINSDTICQITEVKLPLKLLYKADGEFSFRDGSSDCYTWLLTEIDEAEYEKIEGLCSEKNSFWSKKEDNGKIYYQYSRMWGNEIEPPKGESIEEDLFLNIELEKGSRYAKITYGSW